MKKVKRILSLMLAVAMVVTTLGVVTVSTIAENGETPLHEYEWVTVHSESFDGGISTENSGLYTIAEGVTPDYSTGAFVGENLANKKALTLNVTTLPNWKKLLTEAKSVRYSFEAGWSKAGGNELSTTVTIPGLTGVETKPMVRTKSTGSGFEYCVPGMTSDAYKYSGYAGAANPRYEILVNSDGSGYLKAMQSDYPSPTLDVSFEAGKAPSFTLGDKYGLIYVGFDLEQDKFLIDNVKIEVLVEKNYRWNTFFSEDFSTGGINADNADVLTVGSGITDASYANGFFTATNKAGCDSLTLDLTKDAEWATTLANAQEIIYNFDVHVVTGGQNYQTAVGIPALNGGYLTAINKNNTSTASAYVQHYPKGGSDTGGWIYNTAPYTYEVRVDKTGNGQMKVFVQI